MQKKIGLNSPKSAKFLKPKAIPSFLMDVHCSLFIVLVSNLTWSICVVGLDQEMLARFRNAGTSRIRNICMVLQRWNIVKTTVIVFVKWCHDFFGGIGTYPISMIGETRRRRHKVFIMDISVFFSKSIFYWKALWEGEEDSQGVPDLREDRVENVPVSFKKLNSFLKERRRDIK